LEHPGEQRLVPIEVVMDSIEEGLWRGLSEERQLRAERGPELDASGLIGGVEDSSDERACVLRAGGAVAQSEIAAIAEKGGTLGDP
jgi:hypothetical protein